MEEFRRDYKQSTLSKTDLDPDPFVQFENWLKEALTTVPEANAMQLATATKEGKPSCRTVLLKQFGSHGLLFYSNYESRKGRELEQNPYASTLFLWKEMERQVTIEGPVEKISRPDSEKYFRSRPRGAQIGATASRQGSVVPSRAFLDEEYRRVEEEFADKPLPLPPFWGGYRLIPERFEFWQGRQNRLHDRFHYLKKGGIWVIERLSP